MPEMSTRMAGEDCGSWQTLAPESVKQIVALCANQHETMVCADAACLLCRFPQQKYPLLSRVSNYLQRAVAARLASRLLSDSRCRWICVAFLGSPTKTITRLGRQKGRQNVPLQPSF
jgi:hypothetical protein